MNCNTVYRLQIANLSTEEIINKKLFHVFVLGVPRSGTSCMTHICELLGVKMFHTSEDETREYPKEFGQYHPNPTGFYEITKQPFKHQLEVLGTPYSGCKMIVPVRGYRWELLQTIPCKVILMMRNPEEVRQSQEAFYSIKSDAYLIRSYLVYQKEFLKKENIDFIEVDHRDVVKNTRATITKVRDFIHSDKSIDEAVAFVNPKLYRFDSDKIIPGA